LGWALQAISSDVGKKSGKIALSIKRFHGQDLAPHYLAFFDCFNRQLFYEAHEVLEALWLGERRGPNSDFYKGLIQLAGAFVHLQKNRLRPAAALLKLARSNLEKYPTVHERLDVAGTVRSVDNWRHELEVNGFSVNPVHERNPPRLELLAPPA